MNVEKALILQKIDKMNKILEDHKVNTVDGGYLKKLKYIPSRELIVLTTISPGSECETNYMLPYNIFIQSDIVQQIGVNL